MKFPRRYRLVKPSEFRSVFRRSQRSDDTYFRVLASENNVECHRLGMAVSRRASNRAVDRNRLKRVIRESFRHDVAGNQDAMTMDFVVISKDGSRGGSNAMLRQSLESHWQALIAKAGQGQTRTRT